MGLHPRIPVKERILLFGSYGTGKSKAWCQIAAWMRRTKASGNVYVLNTDFGNVERMGSGYGEDFWENVEGKECYEWQEYVSGLEYFRQKGTSDDWLVLDMADGCYGSVQRFFIEQVHGKDAAGWYLDFKKEGGSGHPLAGAYGINWTVINEQYYSWMGKVQRWPGHVLLCTPADVVRQPDRTGQGGDSRYVVETFGRVGVKPKGKDLEHQCHTVLLMGVRGFGKDEEWYVSSIKDREREKVFGMKMVDFVTDYLVGVGGWEL